MNNQNYYTLRISNFNHTEKYVINGFLPEHRLLATNLVCDERTFHFIKYCNYLVGIAAYGLKFRKPSILVDFGQLAGFLELRTSKESVTIKPRF